MERSKLTRSTAPLRRKSGAPTSFLGPPLSSSGSVVSSSEATGSDFFRKRIDGVSDLKAIARPVPLPKREDDLQRGRER